MAEPARQLDDDPGEQSIYDEPGSAPSDAKPNLKVLEGGGETTEPKTGHLKDAGKDQPSRDDMSKAEEDNSAPKHENQVGRGYTKGQPNRTIWRRYVQGKRRALLVGGGLAVLLATISILIFLALLPLKILHIVNNLQSHFYATSENAIQREINAEFSGYVKKVIFCPALKSSVGCSLVCTSNPVSCLWRSWRNNKLEDKLASETGIEFKKVGGSYYIKAPGLPGNGLNIDGFVNSNSGETLDEFLANSPSSGFTQVTRSELRAAIRNGLSTQTRWKQVMYRFKVGRLLEEKYGIKRCIIFCGAKDALADSIDAQKNAAKLYVSERVIKPRAASLAEVLKCLLDPSCNPTDTKPTDTTTIPCKVDVDCELNGTPENAATDTAIRQDLESLASGYGTATGETLLAEEAAIEKDGYDTYLIKLIMKNVFGQDISDAAAKDLAGKIADKIKLITLINMAAQLVQAAGNANTKLKKLSYLTNAAAVVSLYAMYRTYADEEKSGKVNAREVGSLVDSLGPIAKNADMTDLKGGTAGAEQTPLYNSLISQGSGLGSSNYTCNDGKSPVGGSGESLICPEEKLAFSSPFFSNLQRIVNFKNPECGCSLVDIAKAWNATIGAVIGFFGSLVNWVLGQLMNIAQPIVDSLCDLKFTVAGKTVDLRPDYIKFYCDTRGAIAAGAAKVFQFAVSQLFPSPFSENMSGGRTFDLMAAGADVSGNDYAHTGLGGQKLTDQQTASIVAMEDQQALDKYKHESFFARMFDTNSDYSLINKMAMAIPSSGKELQSSVASLITKPFSKLATSFGAIFHTHYALAATAQPDAFGISQYGYPLNDPKLAQANADPQAYWDADCADGSQTQTWNEDAAKSTNIDPNTAMPTNTYTNPCLLIKAAAGSGGGIFDSSVLTTDDLGSQ